MGSTIAMIMMALVALDWGESRVSAFVAVSPSRQHNLYGRQSMVLARPLTASSHMTRSLFRQEDLSLVRLSMSDAVNPTDSENVEDDDAAVEVVDDKVDEPKKGLFSRIKNVFKTPDDGLTNRQRLSKMGLSCLLSYGFVSNMSYAVCISIAWFAFSTKTGLSPLAPGQWKPFLAVYAGFYVFNNIVRPLRVAVSVGLSKYFDRVVAFIQKKTNVSRSLAIGITVFLSNICGTFAAMGLGISLASFGSGVPIFPPKV